MTSTKRMICLPPQGTRTTSVTSITHNWSSFSTGTYRPDDTMCYQTGLPLDKFSFVSTRYD